MNDCNEIKQQVAKILDMSGFAGDIESILANIKCTKQFASTAPAISIQANISMGSLGQMSSKTSLVSIFDVQQPKDKIEIVLAKYDMLFNCDNKHDLQMRVCPCLPSGI